MYVLFFKKVLIIFWDRAQNMLIFCLGVQFPLKCENLKSMKKTGPHSFWVGPLKPPSKTSENWNSITFNQAPATPPFYIFIDSTILSKWHSNIIVWWSAAWGHTLDYLCSCHITHICLRQFLAHIVLVLHNLSGSCLVDNQFEMQIKISHAWSSLLLQVASISISWCFQSQVIYLAYTNLLS